MKKYLVKLVFKVQCEPAGALCEFDEQIRIVEARFAEEAFYKARTVGKLEEEVFKTKGDQTLSWVFIDVSELYAIEQSKHGDQLYSRSYQLADGQSYVSYVKQKSMEIQAKNLTFA